MGLFAIAAQPTLTNTVLFTYKMPTHVSALRFNISSSSKKLAGVPGVGEGRGGALHCILPSPVTLKRSNRETRPFPKLAWLSSLSQEPCLLCSYSIPHGAQTYPSNELMPTSPICHERLLCHREWNCFINSEVLHRCRGWLISCKGFIEHQAYFAVVIYFSWRLQCLHWYMVLDLIIVIILISISVAKGLK